jgi:hypothetical protein
LHWPDLVGRLREPVVKARLSTANTAGDGTRRTRFRNADANPNGTRAAGSLFEEIRGDSFRPFRR